MAPADNIYRSDVDMVDGLDPVIEQMEEYIAHGSVFQDEMDASCLERGWIDVMFEAPQYLGLDLRDVTLFRSRRAEV